MVERLRAEIEQLKRRSGAAPFSKGTRKPNPKRPGRKPGQGFFRFRNPPEQAADVEPVNVPVERAVLSGLWRQAGRRPAGNRLHHRHTGAATTRSPTLRGGDSRLQGVRPEGTWPTSRDRARPAGGHRTSGGTTRQGFGAYSPLRAWSTRAEDARHH